MTCFSWSISCASQSTKQTIGNHESLGQNLMVTSQHLQWQLLFPRPPKKKDVLCSNSKTWSFPSHESLLFCWGPKHVPTCDITGVSWPLFLKPSAGRTCDFEIHMSSTRFFGPLEKLTWILKITPFEKGNHLPNLHFWGFMCVFRSVAILPCWCFASCSPGAVSWSLANHRSWFCELWTFLVASDWLPSNRFTSPNSWLFSKEKLTEKIGLTTATYTVDGWNPTLVGTKNYPTIFRVAYIPGW